MKSICIYGASGHGLVVADVAKACGYKKIIFIDDGKNNSLNFEDIQNEKDADIALGVGDNALRAKLCDKIKNTKLNLVSLVHPSSIIAESVSIGVGVIVMPGVIVNAKATIGDGAILNSGCIVEHECQVGDFAHVSPQVALAGNVTVGKFSHVGIGSCVIQNVTIGESSIIGAGSTVVSSIGSFKKAYGTPCKEVKTHE